MHSHENNLRVIGQALETLGESFELVLDENNFVVYGGPELAYKEKPLTPNRLQRFEWTRRKKVKPQRSRFFISGMRFRERDVIRLDRQGKDIRLCPERCHHV